MKVVFIASLTHHSEVTSVGDRDVVTLARTKGRWSRPPYPGA